MNLALATAVVAVSFAAVFFRLAAPTPPSVAAGIRLVIAALVLAPFSLRFILRTLRNPLPAESPVERLRRLRPLLLAVLAGVCYGAHFGCWVASLGLTTIAASTTLVTTNPLFLALFDAVFARRLPARRLWAALALALPGLLLIGGGDFRFDPRALTGDALALMGALAMSLYLLCAHAVGDKLDAPGFSGVACAVGGAVLLGGSALAGLPLAPPSAAALGWLVLAALIPQLVGHLLLTWSLSRVRPTVTALAIIGEPAGAALLGFLILGETLGAWGILGCALTLAAVAVGAGGRKSSAA